MRTFSAVLFTLLATCQPAVSWGQLPWDNGYITVEMLDGSCFGPVPVGQLTTLRVMYHQTYTNPRGITGAGFQIRGFPSDWMVQAVPNPAAAVYLGNPLGDGVAMAFATCQPDHEPWEKVLLYTLQVIPSSDIGTFLIETRATNYPGYSLDWPLVTLCDPPVFTAREVGCGWFYGNWPVCPCCIDKTSPSPCEAVSIETSTWGQAKQLFR